MELATQLVLKKTKQKITDLISDDRQKFSCIDERKERGEIFSQTLSLILSVAKGF